MKDFKKEFLVGCLVIAVVILMGVFAWLMGTFKPFRSYHTYYLLYQFAGGVEQGSPVRVAGVKVGKVDKIEFLSDGPVALKLHISVSTKASDSIKEDSRFYVNMAGIIGERYIEISPGSASATVVQDGATIRGEDPPRIDQLLSQGYGVFGKVQEFFQANHETMKDFLGQLPVLLTDVTKFLKNSDWRKVMALLDNLNALTEDLRMVTKKFHSEQTQQVFKKMSDLIDRAHQIDKPVLKEFLQEEGIRARIF